MHEIATQGHSRAYILQSVTGQHAVAYRHIILLALSLVSEEVATQIAKKLPSSTTPLSFEFPAKRNPCEYPHTPYISRN